MTGPTPGSLQVCAALIEALPDALVLADGAGRVCAANAPARSLLQAVGVDASNDGLLALLAASPVQTTQVPVRVDGADLALITLHEAPRSERLVSDRLAAIVRSSADAIVSVDLDGVITSWNAGAERMYGYTEAEALGQHAGMLVGAEHETQQGDVLERVKRGEVVEGLETTGIAKDGHELDVALSASPIRDARGAVIGAATIARDISERTQIMHELRRSNRDLEQFAYIASHDLSEPLRVIAGFVDLLARRYRGSLDSDADRFIDFIVTGVERMQTLIDDLLAYSRAGRREVVPHAVDSGAVLRDVLWTLAPQIRECAAEVEVGELPVVHVERTMLRQIFQNLISNAIKFGDAAHPAVRVQAQHVGGAWRFDVVDNGPGVAPRHAERVFEMFQRLHGREVPGSGMGLAIVKRLVERHGGRVWVTAGEPEGSIFSFTIPDRARSL